MRSTECRYSLERNQCFTTADRGDGQRLKSDTIAVFAVLPRYPRYYRGNGIEIHGSTAVIGLELTVFPR